MEGFDREKKQFILDAVRDGEPVKALKDGGDVVMRMDLSEESSSRILNMEFVEWCGGGTIENTITAI